MNRKSPRLKRYFFISLFAVFFIAASPHSALAYNFTYLQEGSVDPSITPTASFTYDVQIINSDLYNGFVPVLETSCYGGACSSRSIQQCGYGGACPIASSCNEAAAAAGFSDDASVTCVISQETYKIHTCSSKRVCRDDDADYVSEYAVYPGNSQPITGSCRNSDVGYSMGSVYRDYSRDSCQVYTQAPAAVPTYPDLYSYTYNNQWSWGDTYATAGQPFALTGATYNQGNAATSGGFYDAFVIADANYSWIDAIPYVYSGQMGPGGGEGKSATYTINTPGTYHAMLCADSPWWAPTQNESNESNNCQNWMTIYVAPPPAANLYSTGGSNIDITAGQTATLTGATYNNGNATAPGGTFYDLFTIYDTAYNYSYANGSTYWTYTDPVYSSAIGPGGGLGRVGYYNFPSPGTWLYRLNADWYSPNGAVGESNEGDNSSGFAAVTVHPITPTGLTYSCNAQGTSMTVGWNPTPGAASGYYIRGTVTNYDNYGATSITYGVTPGSTYSFYLYAENTTSNYSLSPAYLTVGCSGSPDLTAGIGGVVTTTAGQATTFTGTTVNQGTATAGATNDLFIFYNANQSDWNGYQYTARTAALAPGGASSPRSVTYTFGTPGTYYYRLCADWTGEVGEINEGNNCSGLQTVTVRPAPPTIPTPPSSSYSCNANGTQATLTWGAPAGGADNYYVRLYDNSSGSYQGYTDGYTSRSITYPILAGHSYSWWVHSNVGAADYNPSRYSDPSSGPNFSCAGQADLVSYTNGAVTVPAGTPVALGGSTYNYGNAAAPAGTFYDLFRFTNPAGDTWTYPNGDGTYYLYANPTYSGAVAAGGSVTRTTSGFTFNVPGTYYYSLCTDWGGNVSESNEGNNCSATASITVQAADLTVGTISAPATILPNQSVTYSVPVKNIGAGTSGSFPNRFQFTNSSGTVVGIVESSYMTLAGNQTGTASVNYSLPAGTYTIRACANMNTAGINIVTESDYGNNCSAASGSGATTITVAYNGTLSCTFTPSNPEAGQTVYFDAHPAGSATAPYSWNDHEGGSYPNSSTITHVYTVVGGHAMDVSAAGTIGSTYSCNAADGSGAIVQVGCASPHTATLTASPTRVKAGQTTNLTFSGQGINTSCTITGTNGYTYTATANSCLVTTASVTTTPINTQTTFTISCDGGIATKSVLVNVTPQIVEF